MLSQIKQAWKDPYKTRLDQLIEGCTPKYIVWRRQKIEATIFPPFRMRVPVLDLIPKQLSEVDIVRSEFALERLEMEQKYEKLQEIVEKSEENARVHEHKARKMTEGFTKVKDENENLYIANKKLWQQNKNSRIRCFFGTQRREDEASQR